MTALAEIRALRKISRMAGLRVRRRRVPRQLQPDTIRMAYFRDLRAVLASALARVVASLVPLLDELVREAAAERGDSRERRDAPLPPGERVNLLLDRISDEFYREFPNEDLARLAEKRGRETSKFQAEQLDRQIRAATGIQLPLGNPKERARIEQFTAENVALIQSIPEVFFDDVRKLVIRGVNEGTRAPELAASIRERYAVSESRAQLIANDQIGKLFGEMNRARQTDLGITKYVWRTSNDNRVRPEHAEREGVTYDWSDPPADGHPGKAINCRCSPEPDFSAILGDL